MLGSAQIMKLGGTSRCLPAHLITSKLPVGTLSTSDPHDMILFTDQTCPLMSLT